jgi:hypothetical protein
MGSKQMPEIDLSQTGAAYLTEMRGSREKPAVLKAKITTLRASIPETLIFVFEGIDDKSVYHSWIARVSPELKYEPFPCGGKTHVLSLLEIVSRDLNDLRSGIYFFLDRDFDDSRGVVLTENAFMTDEYSIENYLVNEDVLEELLKNEFHCHGQPSVRWPIIGLFTKAYDSFLNVCHDLNFRIYIARRVPIELMGHLPEKISQLASIEIESVNPSAKSLSELVKLLREPTDAESAEHSSVFEKLDPKTRYRGKFSIMFFYRWLSALAVDRNAEKPVHFLGIDNTHRANCALITLGGLASKSRMPASLPVFVRAIQPMT